jgi:hypothetical protein
LGKPRIATGMKVYILRHRAGEFRSLIADPNAQILVTRTEPTVAYCANLDGSPFLDGRIELPIGKNCLVFASADEQAREDAAAEAKYPHRAGNRR